jgi:DNA repair protein RadA/Sms
MKSNKEVVFVCSNCGNEFGRWAGQCPACGEWNSLKEIKTGGRVTGGKEKRVIGKVEAINLGERGEKGESNNIIRSTTYGEFDRVLGKGLVQGSVVLFSGEPGIGKSTLLTQLIGRIGGLYVAGEESASQIASRVKRLGLDVKKFDILETNSVEEIVEFLGRTKDLFKLAIVDSIQVMLSGGVSGVAGSPTQVRETTFRLVEAAKRLGVTIIIVGHVTKEGDIAGPKLLEHMVDTVLYFEGERNSELRILRTTKNRFGATDEVGIFKMAEEGLVEVRGEEIDLTDGGGREALPGKAMSVVMGGNRPMMVEIQALVTESFAPMPKRVFSGIDYNRGQLLVAVAQKVLGVPLYNQDVFVAVSGGMKIEDTGADLAVIGAVFSSYKNKMIGTGRKGVVLFGEVSLLGEVRKVKGWEKRIKEAKGLGREVVEIKDVRELKNLVSGREG